MAIELFATACVIARTQRLIETNGVEADASASWRCATCSSSRRGAASAWRGSRSSRRRTTSRRAVAQHVRADQGYGTLDAILRADDGVAIEPSPTDRRRTR